MPPSPHEAAPGAAYRGFRPEIQGLRAIAVLSVLAYHLWPGALPGGYVGVDVFFVVSGYLITGGLFDEAVANGRIGIGAFYARRIRRLLPAATLVLVVAALALAWLPRTRQAAGTAEIIASALQVQNWWLASRAVDYLASADAPGLLTHFWSLAIEEQYYITWPLLLGLALCWPGARRHPRRVFLVMGLGIVLVSLAYSVWLTGTRPALAYFSTFTRAWELGMGGLLAVLLRWREPAAGIRDLLGWAGLAAIAGAMWTFDAGTPFPGAAALWPVLGTMAVLAAGGSARGPSAYGLLKQPLFQYVGGISYSLYLWHWPVIVLHAAVTGRAPGWGDGLVVIAVAIGLAHISKIAVEDRFRGRAPLVRPGRRLPAAGLAAACLVLSVGAALAGPGWRGERWVDEGPGFAPHPGAAALAGEVDAIGAALAPAPEAAARDLPAPYSDGCLASGGSAGACRYGSADASVRIALVGDAEAVQWQPALAALASRNGWRIHLLPSLDCALGRPARAGARDETDLGCDGRLAKLQSALLTGGFRLVLVAQSPDLPVEGAEDEPQRVAALASGLRDFAAPLASAGLPVALVRGVPAVAAGCTDPARLQECRVARAEAMSADDPAAHAAVRLPGAALLDLTDALCAVDRCAGVVGNVVVYRSDGGLTATYARTLAPAFADRLQGLAGLGAVSAPAPAGLVRYENLGVLAERAGRDDPDLYRDDCHADHESVQPDFCLYGDPASPVRVALVGDSHAAQWLPLLQAHAEREGWALYSYTKSACTFSDAVVVLEGREYRACTEWNRNLVAALRDLGPALVVTSQSRGHQAHGARDIEAGRRALADGLRSRWRTLRDAGMRVLVIADTPWMRTDVPDCLAAGPERGDACDTPVAEAFGMPDTILMAMPSSPGVVFADLNPHLCSDAACPAIIGGQVVWRDQHHLTASYARGLAPLLAPALEQALAASLSADRPAP